MVRIKKHDIIKVANVLVKVKKCGTTSLEINFCKCNKQTKSVFDGYIEECNHFYCSECLANKQKCFICKKPITSFTKIHEYF